MLRHGRGLHVRPVAEREGSPDAPNEDRVRRGYEAFAKGDLDTLSELFADDVVWHMTGRSPLAGEHRGKEAVFALFAKMFQISDGTLRFDVRDVVANDERAIVLARLHMTIGGEQLENDQVAIYEVDADGRTKEATFFVPDPYQWVRADELMITAARKAGIAA